MRQGLGIAGVVVLAGVAVAGWVRQPSPVIPMADTARALTVTAPQTAENLVRPAVYVPSTGFAPAYRTAAPVRVQRVQYRDSGSYRGRGYRDDSYYRDRDYRDDRRYRDDDYRRRPTSHSVAIIGGSAAAGAAIGGLAGHGKGAAIGAITGGLGGFIYDRATRNRSKW